MSSIPEAATAALGVTTAAGTATTVFFARSRAALNRRYAELVGKNTARGERLTAARTSERALHDALRHLSDARLPARALNLISDHHPVPGLPIEDLVSVEYAQLLDDVDRLFVDSLLGERLRIDSAARAVLRGALAEIQAKGYELQTLVENLQGTCDDPGTLRDYFRIDRLNEQIARLIQKAAIVSGAWPGLVRQDTHLPDIVAGAKSRLPGYERIQIHSKLLVGNVGVIGSAAEPIAVACTELMANALESSRGDLSVEVTLLQTDNGTVCIQIDDAGKGMTAEAAIRGTRLVSGMSAQNLLLTELGDPPSLGFAAIGQLVADYGFQVSVGQVSAFGGVRAVIAVPPALLTTIDEKAEPLSAMAPLPAAAPRALRPSAVSQASAHHAGPLDASDLPQRRRRHPSTTPQDTREAQPPDPDKAFTDWTSYERGMVSGRASASTDTGTDTKDNT